MMDKINIAVLIKEHFSSLYVTKNGKKSCDYWAYFYLFCIPLILSSLCLIDFSTINIDSFFIRFNPIETSLGQSLLSSLSILSPLMLGFIPIIYSFIDNSEINANQKEFIKEFKSNVLFTMILSFFAVGFLIIWSRFQNQGIISFIIYFLIFSLGFHILMIIQRFNFLLNEFIKFKSN